MLTSTIGRDGDAFSITEVLLSFAKPSSSGCELLLTAKEIERELNNIEDDLLDNPAGIANEGVFGSLEDLIHAFGQLTNDSRQKLLHLVHTSLLKQTLSTLAGLKAETTLRLLGEGRVALEMYLALAYGVMLAAEKTSTANDSMGNTAVANKKSKNSGQFEWTHQKTLFLEAIGSIMTLPMSRIWSASADRETFVSMLVKTTHLFYDNPENLKAPGIRRGVIDILAWCVKYCNYGFGVKTILLQDLNYAEHLAEPSAELLHVLVTKHDSTQILDEILRDLGSYRFLASDSSAPKIFGAFLLRLGQLLPKELLRNMASIAEQLDSECYTLRMAIIEVMGNLIANMLAEDRSEQAKIQIKSFFAALEERFRDVNAFVRSKVLQVLGDLCRAGAIPTTRRPHLIDLTISRVMDKSSIVRKRAIQLLGDFLRTHPFCVEGGELCLRHFEERLIEIDGLLENLTPQDVQQSMGDSSATSPKSCHGPSDEQLSKKAMATAEQPNQADSAQVSTLLLQKRYYSDASRFVSQLNNVIPLLCQLLSSTTKSEVFEVMDFIVEAHIYKLESAREGVRKMVHLVWERDQSSEDGSKRSIKEHLTKCYGKVFLEYDERLAPKEGAVVAAKNLLEYLSLQPLLLKGRCRMLAGVTVAELHSVEELLCTMSKKQLIPEAVVQVLFQIFGSKQSAFAQRRAALILLTMLAKSDRSIVEKRLDTIVKHGLGQPGQDDPILARYACLALQRLAPSDGSLRWPTSNLVFEKVVSFIKDTCNGPRWLPAIEQGLNAIYMLAANPDVISGDLIKELALELFSNPNDPDHQVDSSCEMADSAILIKLLFVVGHVATCQSLHLETIDNHAKKICAEKKPKYELDQVVATAEDDFSELIVHVREKELILGKESLLSAFGPLVVHICSNNDVYSESTLQNIAALTLAKFMCTSSVFCANNLGLFFAILEHSPDATTRSNLVLALGDMASSFSRLIDQNLSFLFLRLRDRSPTVRRNTLMVLTHLTLNGMIKVKGHVGEIAKCLEDEDARMADLAKLFFTELAGKDNAVYNLIPDLEKQTESIVEKLCLRFRVSTEPRHWRDIALCLSLLSYTSERTLKCLLEAFPLYQDKLTDRQVFQCFVDIITKARKGIREGGKMDLDEFERKIISAHEQAAEQDDGGENAKVGKITKGINRLLLDPTRKPPRARGKTIKHNQHEVEAEDEDENTSSLDSEPEDSREKHSSDDPLTFKPRQGHVKSSAARKPLSRTAARSIRKPAIKDDSGLEGDAVSGTE